MSWFAHFFHWFEVHTGTVNEAGPYYGFFSGFGSDIGEVTLVGALVVGLRHINCHVKGCPRLGKHPVDATPFKTCRKHHPDIPDEVTVEHIEAAHKAAHPPAKKPAPRKAVAAKKVAKK